MSKVPRFIATTTTAGLYVVFIDAGIITDDTTVHMNNSNRGLRK